MILVGLLAAPLIVFVRGYNRLVRLRNPALPASADVEVQLQRRHNVVPNLATIVGATPPRARHAG